MFGSAMLEVAIGIVLLYLLLSLICSALNEVIAGAFRLRARNLHDGICSLLSDPGAKGLAAMIFDHPFIRGVMPAGAKGPPLPSYLHALTFSAALVDVLVPSDPRQPPATVTDLRKAVASITNLEARRVLTTLIDQAEGDLTKVREKIETWFDDSMERVSGWYRRKVHWILLGLGLALSVGLNADTFLIENRLLHDSALRTAVVAQAEQVARQPLDTTSAAVARVRSLSTQLDALNLPLGWSNGPGGRFPKDAVDWIVKVAGLLATTIALSMGAPFWFGVLNRFVNVRNGGRPPERADQA